MVKVSDLKDDGQDSLDRLVEAAQNHKTVPHAVKVATANEKVFFQDSTGGYHAWNGDAIVEYDTRMNAARQEMEAARTRIEEVQTNLDAASARIDASSVELAGMDDRIETAQTAVEAANNSLAQLSTELDSSQADITAVQQATANLNQNISTLEEKAAAAQASATKAQATADGKTSVQYGTETPPPSPGATAGDIYYYTGEDNRIIEQWQWSGSDWVKRKIESAQLANFDAGYITSGYLDVANRIQAGSIYSDKVDAQSVAASVGEFVQVKASNVEVTGDLAARVVNSMDTNSKRLVVTEEAVLQHTTLLGTTVADEINVRKLLRGRDAILDGTLDVAQLNVTTEMSAQIASFMDLTAKKAIVTDEAILNRATIIESLVTPEIVTQRLNASLVTGGVLQTSSSANTGVKIDNNGYKAYDSAGNLAVDLNGKNNLMVGSFATSTQDTSGVKISQSSTIAAIDLYTPQWGGNTSGQQSHAGIWYQIPSTLSDRGLNIVATDSRYVQNTDPGLLLRPGLGGYGFQGSWIPNAPASKSGKYTDTAGLPASAWKDYTFSFATPMVMGAYDQVCVLPSISVQNKNELQWSIHEDTAAGFRLRVVNPLSGRGTGTIYIKWIAVLV